MTSSGVVEAISEVTGAAVPPGCPPRLSPARRPLRNRPPPVAVGAIAVRFGRVPGSARYLRQLSASREELDPNGALSVVDEKPTFG
jgi:hypothetical protein